MPVACPVTQTVTGAVPNGQGPTGLTPIGVKVGGGTIYRT